MEPLSYMGSVVDRNVVMRTNTSNCEISQIRRGVVEGFVLLRCYEEHIGIWPQKFRDDQIGLVFNLTSEGRTNILPRKADDKIPTYAD